MRVDVKKCLFIGAKATQDDFFKKAQKLGVIHFFEVGAFEKSGVSQEVQKALASIKVLMSLPPHDQDHRIEMSRGEEICNEILAINKELTEKLAKRKELSLAIQEIKPLGHFSLTELRSLEEAQHLKFRFYKCAKTSTYRQHIPQELIFAGDNQEFDYFLSIQREPKEYPRLFEVDVRESLEHQEKAFSSLNSEISVLEQRLRQFAKVKDFVHDYLLYILNEENLHFAKNSVTPALDGNLFAIFGWVPSTKMKDIVEMSKTEKVFAEQVAIDPKDVVPTYLENEGLKRVGEDLVHIYDTPSTSDEDPSLWVLFAFALFFGIIVGDAGYGLIYLALSAFCWWKFPSVQGLKRRVLKLFTILSIACVAWGVVSGSYFGIKLDINNPLRQFSALQWMAEKKASYLIAHPENPGYAELIKDHPQLQGVTDPHQFISSVVKGEGYTKTYPILDEFLDSLLMELALFIGIIHICTSMVRNFRRNWALIGWFFFVIGAYLFIPEYLKRTSLIHYVFGIDPVLGAKIGVYMMKIGAGLAVVLALIQHRFLGLLEIAFVIQILTDALSYLRLYALGLAGAVMAATVNEMSANLPLVFAVIVLFAAHIVNMGLGIMGGVIHGLRLNFLEWYHYSFEGGGKRFKPLKILSKDD